MKKVELIFRGFCLLLAGIKIEALKYFFNAVLERKIKRRKAISDAISVKLSQKLANLLANWERSENIVKQLFTEMPSAK